MQDCHVMWFCRELGSRGIPSDDINSGACTAEPSICICVVGVGWWVGVFAGGCSCYVLRLQLVVACAREKGCIWSSFSPFSRPCIRHPGSIFFLLVVSITLISRRCNTIRMGSWFNYGGCISTPIIDFLTKEILSHFPNSWTYPHSSYGTPASTHTMHFWLS